MELRMKLLGMKIFSVPSRGGAKPGRGGWVRERTAAIRPSISTTKALARASAPLEELAVVLSKFRQNASSDAGYR